MLLHSKALDLQSGILIGKEVTTAELVKLDGTLSEWHYTSGVICDISHQPCLQCPCDTVMIVHVLSAKPSSVCVTSTFHAVLKFNTLSSSIKDTQFYSAFKTCQYMHIVQVCPFQSSMLQQESK